MIDYSIQQNRLFRKNSNVKDTFILRLLYKMGAALNMFPANFQTANICNQLVITIILNLVGSTLTVIFDLQNVHDEEYHVFIESTVTASYMLFNLFIMYGFVSYRKKWSIFFR